jgi:hypothetical protein
VLQKKVTHETGIHYSNKPVALLAKKKEFKGLESTTRTRQWRCRPKRKNSRDRSPQLKQASGAAGQKESIRGIGVHNSNDKTALLAQGR